MLFQKYDSNAVRAERTKQLIHPRGFHETLAFELFLENGLRVLLSDVDLLFNDWGILVSGYKQPQILVFCSIFHLLKSSIRT